VTFTKLFSSITASTVWCRPSDTRVVWITMLAMADRHGRVWASIPGLAKESAVSLDACQTAIDEFLAPDPYSRTKVCEGRRIEPIDGGWRLINHAKYRAIRDEEERRFYKTAKQREYRAVDNVDKSGQVLNDMDASAHNAEAEAEAEAKVQKPSRKRKADFSPTAQEVALYKAYPKHTAPNNAYRAIRKALVLKPFDELVLAVGAFSRKCSREGTEEKFIPHPASWFNAGRYDDEEFSRAKSSQASDPGAAYDRKVKAAMAEVRQ
jgi:hypothetical protein